MGSGFTLVAPARDIGTNLAPALIQAGAFSVVGPKAFGAACNQGRTERTLESEAFCAPPGIAQASIFWCYGKSLGYIAIARGSFLFGASQAF